MILQAPVAGAVVVATDLIGFYSTAWRKPAAVAMGVIAISMSTMADKNRSDAE